MIEWSFCGFFSRGVWRDLAVVFLFPLAAGRSLNLRLRLENFVIPLIRPLSFSMPDCKDWIMYDRASTQMPALLENRGFYHSYTGYPSQTLSQLRNIHKKLTVVMLYNIQLSPSEPLLTL